MAGELLALRDISVEESEDLPRILGPLADDAAAAALGRSGALDQPPPHRDALLAAIEAGAPALAKLRVRAVPSRYALFYEWKEGITARLAGISLRP